MKKKITGKCPCCESVLMMKRDRDGKIVFVKVDDSKTKDIVDKVR